MRAITVSVGYGDLLAETLPRSVPHFESILVVTDHEDDETAQVAAQYGVEVFQTNAFYRDGAIFNKGLALEEGFDVMGRDGWMVVLDADIVLPETIQGLHIDPGYLYCPRRRICRNIDRYMGQADWSRFPVVPDREHAGFFQLFHASDPVLTERPWYGVRWKHAGGCDSDFQVKWAPQHKVWLPFEVLHLGPDGTNWCGRCTKRLDGTMPKGAENRRMQMNEILTRRRRLGYAAEWIQQDEE